MKPPEVTIRDARADDLAEIRELTAAAYSQYADTMPPNAWAALQKALQDALSAPGPAERIVAEAQGRLVGSVMLFPAAINPYPGALEPVAWPEMRVLAVDRESRGGGVGTVLVAECARRARASGAKVLGLHTSQSMVDAIRIYGRLGFVRSPEHDFTPPGAELVMGFRLDLPGDGE